MYGYPPWVWPPQWPPQAPPITPIPPKSKNEFRQMLKMWDDWEEFNKKMKDKTKKGDNDKKSGAADWQLFLLLLYPWVGLGYIWMAAHIVQMFK